MDDEPERGAIMLVRIVAIALIGFGVAELIPAVAVQLHASQGGGTAAAGLLSFIWKALLALVGIIMLIKTRAIAEWLDDLLDV